MSFYRVLRMPSPGARRRGDRLFLKQMKSFVTIMIVLAIALAFSLALFCGQQAPPSSKSEQAQVKPEPEKIVSGPQNIKERTAIYVFVGWTWVAIGVLVYFLRLKVKEIDRLYSLRFFSSDKK